MAVLGHDSVSMYYDFIIWKFYSFFLLGARWNWITLWNEARGHLTWRDFLVLRFSFYFTSLWSYNDELHKFLCFVLWQRFRTWNRICQSRVELILTTPAPCTSSLCPCYRTKDFGPEDGLSLELMSQKSTTLWFVFCGF